jgi:glycosyltransferase involved in cell wall biosynthesis
MAVILKKPNKNNKGIVIVTHKEGRTKNQFQPYRKHYLIGTHIGWDLSHDTPRVLANQPDFILSSFSHLGDDIPKDMVIELNARNFLPNHFNYENKDKQYLLDSIDEVHKFSKTKISEKTLTRIKESNDDNLWDLVWVNRPCNVKNIKEFLDNVSLLFKEHGKCNVLLVCAINNFEKSPSGKPHHLDVEQYIKNKFTEEEREYIDLLRPDSDGGCLGVDNKFIAPFYHWSKAYAFYSPVEGDARALHEALCGNCYVVYYKDLKGAGKDYLKEDNSFSFDTYEESYKALYEAINSDKVIDLEYINERCFQDKSIEVLKEKLKPIYEKIGQEFDGKLLDVKNLNIELPAHNHNVPWRDNGNVVTGDLSPHMFNTFVKTSTLLTDENDQPLNF